MVLVELMLAPSVLEPSLDLGVAQAKPPCQTSPFLNTGLNHIQVNCLFDTTESTSLSTDNYARNEDKLFQVQLLPPSSSSSPQEIVCMNMIIDCITPKIISPEVFVLLKGRFQQLKLSVRKSCPALKSLR